MIRMLCCYKFTISAQKFFVIKYIAKNFCALIVNFSKQIIRSKILNRLLGMKIEMIAIGDELISGFRTNTNGAFIGKKLFEAVKQQ